MADARVVLHHEPARIEEREADAGGVGNFVVEITAQDGAAEEGPRQKHAEQRDEASHASFR